MFIHNIEYCLAIKINEVLICATIWMKFDYTYCIIPFIPISRRGKSIKTESRIVIAKVRDCWRKWRVTENQHSVSFVGNKNVLKLIVVMIAQLCEYTKNH